jgi:hypothetical protein
VDDPWNGGCGYQGDPGDLTLDQVLMRLVDRKNLKARLGGGVKAEPLAVASLAGDDGKVRGRAGDGTVLRAKICGKSLARQLMEKENKKRRRKGRRRCR